jgi:hypothetical protein
MEILKKKTTIGKCLHFMKILIFIQFQFTNVFFSQQYSGNTRNKEKPVQTLNSENFKKYLIEQDNKAIKEGKIPDPKVVKELTGNVDTNVPFEMMRSYPVQDSKDYEKYKGYIADGIVKGGQYTTYELDKMLADAKRKVLNRNLAICGTIIFIIFTTLILVRKSIQKSEGNNKHIFEETVEIRPTITNLEERKNHHKVQGDDKPMMTKLEGKISDHSKTITTSDIITDLEKLLSLKEKGVISELEFERLKNSLIN